MSSGPQGRAEVGRGRVGARLAATGVAGVSCALVSYLVTTPSFRRPRGGPAGRCSGRSVATCGSVPLQPQIGGRGFPGAPILLDFVGDRLPLGEVIQTGAL